MSHRGEAHRSRLENRRLQKAAPATSTAVPAKPITRAWTWWASSLIASACALLLYRFAGREWAYAVPRSTHSVS
jgi:hypothetical protein